MSLPKPEPRARAKRRQGRVEGQQAAKVRALCVKRDGFCRLRLTAGLVMFRSEHAGCCDGHSEWAHMERRFKTRGMAPERRHQTGTSLMLCTFHHQLFDAHRLNIQAASSRGADGPLAFAVGRTIYVEPERGRGDD